MLLYYITDRRGFPGDESSRRRALLERIAQAARNGVDFIQLREKDLPTWELEQLAEEALRRVRSESASTRLLVNSRLDVALAVGADGVHLTADDISPADVRAVVARVPPSCEVRPDFLVGVSCHSLEDVHQAEAQGADFAVLAPIFEKVIAARPPLPGVGLEALRQAAQGRLPVLALGGVSLQNAAQCLAAGAAGIAAIRLFQQGDMQQTVAALRRI